MRASGCSRIAPVVKSLASVINLKGLEWSGSARTGAVTKAWIKVWNDVSWGEAQMKGTSFLVRLNKVHAISKKFLINRL